jgi:hypothetical protein
MALLVNSFTYKWEYLHSFKWYYSPSHVRIICNKNLQVECRGSGTFLTSVIHELCFACSWITLNKVNTVWLNDARPANICIMPSSLWQVPAQPYGTPATWVSPHHSWASLRLLMNLAIPNRFMSKHSAAHEWLGESKVVAIPPRCAGVFPGKEGVMKVLAGLALAIPNSRILI